MSRSYKNSPKTMSEERKQELLHNQVEMDRIRRKFDYETQSMEFKLKEYLKEKGELTGD